MPADAAGAERASVIARSAHPDKIRQGRGLYSGRSAHSGRPPTWSGLSIRLLMSGCLSTSPVTVTG